MKLEEIGDAKVERAMKKMKRRQATGIDEVRVEMLVMAEHVGLGGQACIKYLHETGEDPRGVADGVDSSCMEKKGRCSQPWKIPRYQVAEPCPEGVRKDSGWKDKEDSRM